MGNDMRRLDMDNASIIAKFSKEHDVELNRMIDLIISIATEIHRVECDGINCEGVFPFIEQELKRTFIQAKFLTERDKLAVVATIYYAQGVSTGHDMGADGLSKMDLNAIQDQQAGIQELKNIINSKNRDNG